MKSSVQGIFAEIYNNKEKLKTFSSKAKKMLKRKGVDVLAQHMTPEDIIFEIIVGVLTGRIKWDRDHVPDINSFMYNQLNSYIANLRKKELKHQIIYRSCYECLPTPYRRKFTDIQANEEDEQDVPGITKEEVIGEQNTLDLLRILKEEMKNDILAYYAFEDKLLGYSSRDSAIKLKKSETEVNRARRRADKMVSKIAKMLSEDEYVE